MSDIIEKLRITPGPWEIKESDHENGIEFDSIGPVCYEWTYGDGWIEAGEDIEEGRRNAMVIVAAPEMLEDGLKNCELMRKMYECRFEPDKIEIYFRQMKIKSYEKASDLPFEKLKELEKEAEIDNR